MSDKVTLTVSDLERDMPAVKAMVARGLPAGKVLLTFGRPTRSTDQNAKLWAMLSDFAKQVTHHSGLKHSADDWKAILSAAFEDDTRMAPNLDGNGLVFLGAQTRKYTVKVMSDFIAFCYAAGSDREIVWSEQAAALFNEHGVQVGA